MQRNAYLDIDIECLLVLRHALRMNGLAGTLGHREQIRHRLQGKKPRVHE
jgi:hypothetical protein